MFTYPRRAACRSKQATSGFSHVAAGLSNLSRRRTSRIPARRKKYKRDILSGMLLSETDNIVPLYTRQRGPEKSSMVPAFFTVSSRRGPMFITGWLYDNIFLRRRASHGGHAVHRLVAVFSRTNPPYTVHRGYFSAGEFMPPPCPPVSGARFGQHFLFFIGNIRRGSDLIARCNHYNILRILKRWLLWGLPRSDA